MAQAPRTIPAASIAKMLPVITGLAAVGYAVAAYGLLFMPKIGKLVKGGELDVSAFDVRIAETESYSATLDAAAAAYKKINPDRRARVLNMVPLTPDAPGLYVQFDALARQHGLVVVSIDAVPDEKSLSPAGRKTVRVALNVTGGTYQQFKLFLADLERSERVFDAQAVIFTPTSGNFGLVVRAYYLDAEALLNPTVDPAAAAAAAAPAESDL